jgi:hypothetical protein
MPGRKKLPTKFKLIKGTDRKCRTNKSEPIAPDEPPRSAISLPSSASFWYGVAVSRIQSLGVGSVVNSEMVMLLAIVLEGIEADEKDIGINGRQILISETKTYRGEVILGKDGKPVETVKPITNPAVMRLSDGIKRAQSLLAEFGLSPSSQSKVSRNDKPKESANPFEAFN